MSQPGTPTLPPNSVRIHTHRHTLRVPALCSLTNRRSLYVCVHSREARGSDVAGREILSRCNVTIWHRALPVRLMHVERAIKVLLAMAVGTMLLMVASVSLAQSGNMMNGGMWGSGWMGGYGGVWVPILIVIVVVGVVAWFLKQKGK